MTMTAVELAQALDISVPQVEAALERLKVKGLVTQEYVEERRMKSLQLSVNAQHQYVLVCLLDGQKQECHLCDGLDPLADAIEAFMGINYVDAWEQAVALSKAAYAANR